MLLVKLIDIWKNHPICREQSEFVEKEMYLILVCDDSYLAGGIVNNTLRPPVPSYCDAEWRLLMEQCWAPDPVVRPSFTEIARRLRVMSAASQSKPHGHQPQSQLPK